jgi:4-hydroxybenzoyl-CoA thioesterase/acyl-CoA thioester hydrolase
MPEVFRATRRVEFRDTDAAGIIHFSRFFTFMEEVEHEFLRSLGLSVLWRDGEGPISWPRVSATCDISGTVRFEDELDVELHVERLGEKSVTYACKFEHGGRAIATGKVTAVCCRLNPGQVLQSIPIPAEWREKLGRFASA